jgi:pyruvate dehydrogenase E2 component (dihydrolipoamide acetyltransferase)
MAMLSLPQPAKHISSVTVLRWLVSPGDAFDAGVQLLELEAEEAIITVTAKTAGILIKPLVTPSQTLLVGAKLAEVEIKTASSGTKDAPLLQTNESPQHSELSEEQFVNDESSNDSTGAVDPILMPQAGNTMEEGSVLEWRVKEGDTIELGQILCEIETDKATMEYESPVAGRLARIVAPLNEPVAVKELIAVVADSDAAADAYLASQGSGSVASETGTAPPVVVSSAATTNKNSHGTATYDAGGRIKASPAARKLSAAQGLSLATVGAGSGPGGRILSSDLSRATASAASLGVLAGAGGRRPMSKMRRAIGANLQRSKQTVPHFYVRLTINATPLQEFYREQKPLTDCSLNDLVVLGVGRTMREFPAVRSQIDSDDIVEFPHANIGIAVGVEDGLVVPVVLNVDTLSLAQLAQESKRVVEAGRNGSLENFGKGNFTISNLGMFGVEEFSAIINPPESGILAVSAVRETVIVENGSLRPGRVMTMTLSADHRVVDGLLAAKYMARLKEILENPTEELS